ncbi:hypothetical protein HN51_070078, partial [Arachis hypogaea]
SKYQFVPPDLHWAQKNFEKRDAALLKNLLRKARASNVKPRWIGEVMSDALCAYRNTDAGFLQKSAQEKKSLKRSPTQLELFVKTHKHKDKIWVDKKSKHIE